MCHTRCSTGVLPPSTDASDAALVWLKPQLCFSSLHGQHPERPSTPLQALRGSSYNDRLPMPLWHLLPLRHLSDRLRGGTGVPLGQGFSDGGGAGVLEQGAEVAEGRGCTCSGGATGKREGGRGLTRVRAVGASAAAGRLEVKRNKAGGRSVVCTHSRAEAPKRPEEWVRWGAHARVRLVFVWDEDGGGE